MVSVELGSYIFADGLTRVQEEHEEVGGREGRVVVIEGVVEGTSRLAVEAELDTLLDVASATDAVVLKVRSGRQMDVRRRGFSREVARDDRTGRFLLRLEAEQPYEYASQDTVVNWTVSASGDTQVLSTSGTVWTPLRVAITASGDLVEPMFSDGVWSMTYEGILGDGQTLVLDGVPVSHFKLREFENQDGLAMVHPAVVEALERVRRDLCDAAGETVWIVITDGVRTQADLNRLAGRLGWTHEGGAVSRNSMHLAKYGGIAVDLLAKVPGQGRRIAQWELGAVCRKYFDFVKDDYADGHVHADMRVRGMD